MTFSAVDHFFRKKKKKQAYRSPRSCVYTPFDASRRVKKKLTLSRQNYAGNSSSKADSYADPIPNLGQVAKTNIVRANRNRFSCEIGCGGDGARVICSFARVIQQLGFGAQKIQANVDYCCYIWSREETRRVHFARPCTQSIQASAD